MLFLTLDHLCLGSTPENKLWEEDVGIGLDWFFQRCAEDSDTVSWLHFESKNFSANLLDIHFFGINTQITMILKIKSF